MQAAQDGDAVAYTRLLRSVAPVVRALGRRRGLDPSACEDLSQDVLMTLHRIRHTYDPARPFGPWLIAIAQRRLIDRLRRDGRRQRHEAHDPDAVETFPAAASKDGLEADEAAAALREAIATLPPRQREALELTKLREMSVADAAALSGQTPGALKVNVHRALRALQRRLGGAE
jgi:RNA polymerase sigma-70 factor (ECF subfamily)